MNGIQLIITKATLLALVRPALAADKPKAMWRRWTPPMRSWSAPTPRTPSCSTKIGAVAKRKHRWQRLRQTCARETAPEAMGSGASEAYPGSIARRCCSGFHKWAAAFAERPEGLIGGNSGYQLQHIIWSATLRR
jgi:hypothetical protein